MKSVVIVDDDNDILELLNYFFSKFENITIKTFDNPITAFGYIKKNKTDLVVSDITMPGIDGIELLQKVKGLKNPPKMVMISANSTLDRVLKSHRYEADDYITKPMNMGKLRKKFELFLN